MSEEAQLPDGEKPKRKRKNYDRTGEYLRRKQRQREAGALPPIQKPMSGVDPDSLYNKYADELGLLERRTKGNPSDWDADIDFAYQHMFSPSVTPIQAPSTSAWAWYVYARTEPSKFLEAYAKRGDAKNKQSGALTNQRMEDDKRQQFAMIDRIERELTIDVKETIRELMTKYPFDVLRECRTFDESWKAFLEEDAYREKMK